MTCFRAIGPKTSRPATISRDAVAGQELRLRLGLKSGGLLSRRYGFEPRRACPYDEMRSVHPGRRPQLRRAEGSDAPSRDAEKGSAE